MAKKLILIGLVQAKPGMEKEFEEWYLGNHVEDTFNCPNLDRVMCFKAVKGFMGESPSQYLTVYEAQGEDADEAERLLGEYQMDPNGWDKRLPNNDSMAIVGAGWYLEEVAFGHD